MNPHPTGWSQEPQDIISRLMDKVKILDNGCWLFTGSVSRNGYGWSSLFGKTVMAHRASYLLYVGDIPKGMHLHHICALKLCVNPAHLQVVAPRAHIVELSPAAPAFANFRKTHCKYGHPFTLDNTLIFHRKGSKHEMRVCRACKRLASRTRRARLHPDRKSRPERRVDTYL